MDEPITQTELLRYQSYKMQNENHYERLERMKNQALIPAQTPSDGSQRTNFGSDRMANAAVRYMDEEPEIMAQIAANSEKMKRMRTAIIKLIDPQEAEVLRLRYIDGDGKGRQMPWKDVAAKIYHRDDESALQMTFRLHGRALLSIRRQES